MIGSGFMTHGLPFLTPTWSAREQSQAGRGSSTRGLTRHLPVAISTSCPLFAITPRHALRAPERRTLHTLFVTLGAATADITTAIDGFFWGLSKRSLQVA